MGTLAMSANNLQRETARSPDPLFPHRPPTSRSPAPSQDPQEQWHTLGSRDIISLLQLQAQDTP